MNHNSATNLPQQNQQTLPIHFQSFNFLTNFLTMPIRPREPAQRPGFFHRQRPLHAVLGGGKRKIFFTNFTFFLSYQSFNKNLIFLSLIVTI